MIHRRAAVAEIETKIRNHTFRATGITAYLKNGGTLEKAATMANHARSGARRQIARRRERLWLIADCPTPMRAAARVTLRSESKASRARGRDAHF
ncbi:protein of unknown function (plasmid) [Methylocella tundrae]|jgi:hypothetical protein|uniref:Uncharacterized protein n=1 Tax=Methylocella tundrae TaxID=227605 RepID=A0A4U8Z723_METTU|nr:protein of unknown function [Methylocella tundrae]